MARNLMPKSGAMAPYIVVNRDAAVAGVFSVDGELGAVNLTTKYLRITDFNQKIGTVDQKISTIEGDIVLINQAIGTINTTLGTMNTTIGNKAAKGSNNDITELKGLNVALSVAQGGTGAKDIPGAKANLEVERVVQVASWTQMFSPKLDGTAGRGPWALTMATDGTWGVRNNDGSWRPLDLNQGGTGSATPAGARNNLELGDSNTPTFAGLNLKGNNLNLYRDSDDTGTSASLLIQKRSASGAWRGRTELRANDDGGVEWIKRDGSDTGRGIQLTNDNYVTFNGMQVAPPYLELGIKNVNTSSYIDFHYAAKYDYDARIICDGINSDQVGGGNLRFYSGYMNFATKGSYQFDGGRFRVATSDAVFDTQVGFAGGSLQIPGVASDTTPVGAGLRGIHAGVDSNAFDKASNISLYSWYGVAFCTAYTAPTNGIVQGKPAVLINTRDGNVNTMGVVISKGVTLTSDIRKKDDIKPINGEESSEKLARLGTYTYHYKGGTTYTAGVIAQEVEKEFPELISENEADDNALQVDYMGLMGHMHAAFKSEREKRIALEERLAKMEAFLATKFSDF